MLARSIAQLSAALAVSLAPSAAAQAVDARVDERVELLAVVFRLAGRAEYNLTRVPGWAAAVDSHFTQFRDHPAVAMTRRLRFGFFIPMNLAVHVSMPPELSERSAFATVTSLHRRWTAYPDSTWRYLELLRSFAREARFGDFMAANRPLIDSATARLRHVANGIDQAWLERFWGGPPGMGFILVAGLTNGGASYGQEYVPASGKPEAYAIMGVGRADSNGFPLYDASDAPTVLHELNHPFVTPLMRENGEAFRPFAESLYAPVARQMQQQFYGTPDAMLNESLVRAAVPRYYLAHGDTARAEQAIHEEIASGFVWTRGLVDLFGEYERNRASYPTMSAFMPRVVAFLRDWSRRRP
jgi:hypothetical protein